MLLKEFVAVYHDNFDVMSARGNVLATTFKNYPHQDNIDDYMNEPIKEILSVPKGVHVYLDFA